MSGWSASSFWGSATAGSSTGSFDTLVEKVTSDHLPSGTPLDLATSLDICDALRSGQVAPATAAKVLVRKRVMHKNPNVQLLALDLLDLAVKNGGQAFIEVVASREVMDNLAQLARQETTAREVREKVLGLIQSWEPAFSTKSELFYTSVILRQLQAEGAPFPAKDDRAATAVLTGAMVETSTAPTWRDAQVCERCRTPFTLTNRKHHCRNCGGCFCQLCCGKQLALPWFGIAQPVRVCETCFVKPQAATTAAGAGASFGQPATPANQNPVNYSLRRASTTSNASSTARNPPARKSSRRAALAEATTTDEDDADLKRALQLSLEESERMTSRPGAGFATKDEIMARGVSGNGAGAKTQNGAPRPVYDAHPTRSLYPTVNTKSYNDVSPVKTYRPSDALPAAPRDTPDDPDLAAAIAASLADVKMTPGPSSTSPSAPPVADLSQDDMELMDAFCAHVNTVMSQPGQDLIRDSRGQALYEQVNSTGGPGGLRMKLIKALDGSSERAALYEGMHEKLGRVVRLYDGCLDRHLRSPETRSGYNEPRAQAQPPPQHYTAYQQSYEPYPAHYTGATISTTPTTLAPAPTPTPVHYLPAHEGYAMSPGYGQPMPQYQPRLYPGSEVGSGESLQQGYDVAAVAPTRRQSVKGYAEQAPVPVQEALQSAPQRQQAMIASPAPRMKPEIAASQPPIAVPASRSSYLDDLAMLPSVPTAALPTDLMQPESRRPEPVEEAPLIEF